MMMELINFAKIAIIPGFKLSLQILIIAKNVMVTHRVIVKTVILPIKDIKKETNVYAMTNFGMTALMNFAWNAITLGLLNYFIIILFLKAKLVSTQALIIVAYLVQSRKAESSIRVKIVVFVELVFMMMGNMNFVSPVIIPGIISIFLPSMN